MTLSDLSPSAPTGSPSKFRARPGSAITVYEVRYTDDDGDTRVGRFTERAAADDLAKPRRLGMGPATIETVTMPVERAHRLGLRRFAGRTGTPITKRGRR